ncbi:hypothetical protein CAEBREN_12192 [Caenorhabditis brenneri]|uniref:Uncharacterized protein n=1 Tax=Caenorhabditis brenneri TaxID=135651 RepID=G0NSP4_CAEBE|nr:hypothetical protein CAEBREN_12192 [Caenorhabditis brenneri]
MYNNVTYTYTEEEANFGYTLFAALLMLSFLGLIIFIANRHNHPLEEEETDEKTMESLRKVDMFQC